MRTLIKTSIYFSLLILLAVLFPLKTNADSLTWTSPQQVSSLTGSNSPYSSVGTDSNNTVHAVWQAQGGVYGGNPLPAVYYANKPEGGSWTTPINLLQNFKVFDYNYANLAYGMSPNLFIDSQDKIHVAWWGKRTLDDFPLPLFYAVRNIDGTWTYPSSSPLFWPSVSGAIPTINVEQGGRVNLVYVDPNTYDIYYSTRASDNTTDQWSQPLNLSNGSGGQPGTIATDTDGNVYVAWGGNNGIEFSERIGTTWTAPQALFPGVNPKIIIDSNQNLHLFWTKVNPYPTPLSVQYSSKAYDSSTWSEPTTISDPNIYSLNPSISIGSNNSLHVVYISNNNNVLYTTKETSGWSVPVRISDYAYVSGVDIATDSNNLSHVIWYQGGSLYYADQKPSDSIPPTTNLTQSPQPNTNGWNNTDVTINLNATDNDGGSGVKEIHYTVNGGNEQVVPGNSTSFTVSTEGTNTITYWAVDNAGNIEQVNNYSLKIDKTPPTITINSPVDGSIYILNQPVFANWTAIDSLSGLASSNGTVASGQSIATSTPGTHTFTVTATDTADNISTKTVIYYVHYNFGSFLPPLGNDKVFKINGTIPVKFQLTDYNGNPISNVNVYLYVAKITDNIVGTDEQATSNSNADTGNQFHYDPTSSIYIYNLSTQNPPLGTSGTYQLKAVLDDGSFYTIDVSLK